jgi:VIT1/CCC1 family predicted Fe2+/Mn2+ transporter
MLAREKLHEKGTLLRDAVFASDDGLITTFAVVAGSFGASLSPSVVLVLGFANLFADGISMSTGTYLGAKSEIEYETAEDKGAVEHVSPFRHGLITFISFGLAGLIPLLPFVFSLGDMFMASALLVVIALFAIGSLRSLFTHKSWFGSGVEMLVIGGVAALVAYGVGYAIDRFVL